MKKPHAELRAAITTYIDRLLKKYVDQCGKTAIDPYKTTKHSHIRFVNRESEKLMKAFKAVSKEHVYQLPGRAQKGAVDAALTSVTPKISKQLRV